jgi:S-formylglutathione hydrolase FrmB
MCPWIGRVPRGDRAGASLSREHPTQDNTVVHQLAALNIPVTVDAYGAGTHTWPYWQSGLHRSLPLMLKALVEKP